MAFLRIKLLEVLVDRGKPHDPFCAVNIKEAIEGGDGSVTLQQQKKTFYPDWDRCFDSHLHHGRRMQIIVMDRLEGSDVTPVAEVTVETEALAHECMDEPESNNAVKLAVSCVVNISSSRCMLKRDECTFGRLCTRRRLLQKKWVTTHVNNAASCNRCIKCFILES